VRSAMRYGQPSVASRLDALKEAGCTRILVLPMYPQYSGTTTASVLDAVYQWAGQIRHVPELRFINRFHDDVGYIDALASRIRMYWDREGRGDHMLMSFHGVPRRTLDLGDPYHCECLKTARMLAERLGLASDAYTVSFQSRLGRAKWLEPYTEPTLEKLASQGVKHLQVICPGFVSDCLETLEEISIEGRATFMTHGGQRFDYIPCLNDHDDWIRAMGALVEQHTAGWPVHAEQQPEATLLERQRQRAIQQGAKG
jgi:protoporphyrin/coproporphyrin ferrochelatase